MGSGQGPLVVFIPSLDFIFWGTMVMGSMGSAAGHELVTERNEQ